MILGPAIFFAKVALFLLYWRVFSIHSTMRWAIYVGCIYAFFLYWSNLVVTSVYCAPAVNEPWTVAVGVKCKPASVFGVIQGTLNVVLDLYLLFLPIPVVMRLQMAPKKRVGIVAVFMTGIL